MCLSLTLDHPEDVLSQREHEGFQYVVMKNMLGYRCGYVHVPAGHPWHGKGYNNIDCEVHGGLTFAAADAPCGKAGPNDGWWIGFDAAHVYDAPDPALMSEFEGLISAKEAQVILKKLSLHERPWQVRDQKYMEAECESLCEQARDARFLATEPSR